MRRPAARVTVRSHVRNCADEPTCIGALQRGCWRQPISDFGGQRAWQERQWADSLTASSCPCCSQRPSFWSGTCWARA